MTDQWQPMMFAPRDGTAFEARTRQGMIFGCRFDERRKAFVNTATNHRVNPRVWRQSYVGQECPGAIGHPGLPGTLPKPGGDDAA
jgi:hypothetical protein